MPRYIDPRKINLITHPVFNEDMELLVSISEVRKAIAQTPTEDDVVKVVRCKNCVHWGGITYGFVCRKLSGIDTKICMGAEQFCSYGEVKNDER